MNITRFMNGKLEIRQTIENFDYPYTQTAPDERSLPSGAVFHLIPFLPYSIFRSDFPIYFSFSKSL